MQTRTRKRPPIQPRSTPIPSSGWNRRDARPTQHGPSPAGRARTLAQRYRHFGEVEVAATSPLYARWAGGGLGVSRGVGVAPAIPTLGERRDWGHSIIGLAMVDRSVLGAEALGRCWSQGRLLAWLTDS